jgi:hypothetical protein
MKSVLMRERRRPKSEMSVSSATGRRGNGSGRREGGAETWVTNSTAICRTAGIRSFNAPHMTTVQSTSGVGGAGLYPQEPSNADILSAVRDLTTKLDKQMDAMGQQMDAMAQQMDAMGQQMDAMGQQMDAMGQQMDAIGQRIDAIVTRLKKGQGQSRHSPLGTSRSNTPSADVVEGRSSKRNSGFASGGGGGGGGKNAQKTPPLSPSGSGTSTPKNVQLRAAFLASPQQSHMVLKTGSSRDMSTPLQGKVMVHRFRTEPRLSEFDYVALDLKNSLVQPNPEKGLSLFIVASEDPQVVAAAHVVRGAITKGHHGCLSWCLATLPQSLVVTLDRELEKTAEGVPIVWHATLSPRTSMTFTEFEAAFEGWADLTVCKLRDVGKEDCEIGPVHRDDLCTFSGGNAPYLLAKLNEHCAALVQNAGGSPGTA